MEEGDLKTSPRKDITNVEADENTLPNGFDDPLCSLGLLNQQRKLRIFVLLNDALTPLSTSTSFPPARKTKCFFLILCEFTDAEKSLCIVINYLDTSFFELPLGSAEAELIVEENWNMTWNGDVMLTEAQYQQFLPLSPIILSAPVTGIPK